MADRMTAFHLSRVLYLVLYSVLIFILLGLIPRLSAASSLTEKNEDYFEVKGGLYYPSERFDLSDLNNTRTTFNKKGGVSGEVAVGHYYHRYFGMEFGVGYLETKRLAELTAGSLRVEAVPILLSAKLFLPLGLIEPYGEIGVGGYFTKFELVNALGQKSSDRDFDFGPHAGAGININFTDTFYLGFQGRFRRVRPEFTNQTLRQTARLNGYTATINFGFRY